MARRITDAAGIVQLGDRIRYTLTQVLNHAQDEKLVVVQDAFIWTPEMEKVKVRDRSNLPSS